MPLPVVPPPLTPTQEDRVRELVASGIQAWLATTVPGYVDPTTKQPITYATAIKRGTTAYPYVISGGPLEKRVTSLETRVRADDTDDAAAVARLGRIEDALDQPILDRPAT